MDTIEDEREVEVRTNGSQVFTEPYSEGAIERLKHIVMTYFANGERKFYSISVDGEVVVPKNSDGRKFNRYLQFLNKFSNLVEVRMYQGNSPNCNKHQFVISKGLAGPAESTSSIHKALEHQRLEIEVERLSKELRKKDKKLRKYKKMQEESKSGLAGFTELIGTIAPIVQAFKGGTPPNQIAGIPEHNGSVQIEPEEKQAPVSAQVDELKKRFDGLIETYGEDGLKNLFSWIQVLGQHPQLIDKIKEELNNLKKEKDGGA